MLMLSSKSNGWTQLKPYGLFCSPAYGRQAKLGFILVLTVITALSWSPTGWLPKAGVPVVPISTSPVGRRPESSFTHGLTAEGRRTRGPLISGIKITAISTLYGFCQSRFCWWHCSGRLGCICRKDLLIFWEFFCLFAKISLRILWKILRLL